MVISLYMATALIPRTGSALSAELDSHLNKVQPTSALDYTPPISDAKAIIAPWVLPSDHSYDSSLHFVRHAGYSYSGPAAAWAYAAIPTDKM